MPDYITLMGAEEVSRAARAMSSAADEMQRAANNFSHSIDRMQQLVERFEAAAATLARGDT